MARNSRDSKDLEEYKFRGIGLSSYEKRGAKKQFEEYKSHYHIDSLSDLQVLEELVFREAIQERYKKQVEKLANYAKSQGKEQIAPKSLTYALDQNLERILELREKLGFFEDKKAKDPYKYIQILKKKFKKYLEENQGSRELICPHCSKMIMLKIKTDKWEEQKHPLFKDRILANKHLWTLYKKEGKITKEDIAKILGVSIDYIGWLERKIFKSNNPS